MRHVGLIFCSGLLLAMLARPARTVADTEVTINTDRPAVTNASPIVPLGALQVESGLLVTDTGGHHVLDFPELLLRYGLLQKTELRLTLPNYFHNLPESNGAASGFGDLTPGVQQQLGPIAGFDLWVIAFLSLPTGAEAISSHGYDPGVQLPWMRSLSANWTVEGQLAAYWPTRDGGRNYTSEITLLFDRQLTAPWDAFIEYAGDFPQRGGSSQLLHLGSAYKPAPHQQIDLHAAVGLTDAAPRWYVGVGYSLLFLGH
jgi:hypothetical protein